MKATLVALATFGLASVLDVQAARTHPIENVITMLKGLAAQAEEEGKAEALVYQKFEKWCADNIKTLNSAITDEQAAISSLTSGVAAKKQAISTLTREISELESQLAEYAKADATATADRAEAAALFEQQSEDLGGTVKAVTDALADLEGASAASFVEVAARPQVRKALAFLEASQPEAAKKSNVAALLQASRQRPELLAGGGAAGATQRYAFKADNILELLKELKSNFEAQLLQATKEETNSLNAYTTAKKARDAATAAAESSKDEKTKDLADAGSALSEGKGNLADTQANLAADTESLESVRRQCATKQQEWKERSAVRANEIKALGAASQILAKASGVRTEAPSNPEAPTSPLDFMQTGQTVDPKDPKMKAVALLLAAAHKAKSAVLERMAQQLSLHLQDGPFDKVNAQIQKMIFRLMAEQKDEDTHKLWCDQELSKSEASKSNKQDRVAELTLKIEAGDATVQLLSKEVEEAQNMVAELTSFISEATEIRQVGKTENQAAIKDAQDAQTAIAQAITVLEGFYKSSGAIGGDSFLQRGPVTLPDAPESWGAEYTGVADPSKQPAGVVAVLQATAAEFAKMEADTKAQEVLDQKAFEQSVKDASIEKARREGEVEAKNQQKTRLLDKLNGLRKSHKEVSNELASVEQYLKDLEPACLSGDSTYEERKSARTAEIEALRQAQGVLRDAFKEQPEQEGEEHEAMLTVKQVVKRSFLQVSRA